MIKKRYIPVLLLLFFVQNIIAQDPIFTQFYAVPTMTNPAFAGSERNTRLGMGYRNQWMTSSYNLSTFFISADKYLESINSGLGVSILDQNESLTGYNYLQVDISYSYHIKLTDSWTFFPGLSIGYGFKQFDLSKIILGDQLDIGNGIIFPGSSDPLVNNDNVHFFDISAGGIFYSENAWLGISTKHLTKPDIAFTNQDEMQLEILFSVHGGYKWSLNSSRLFPEDTNIYLTTNFLKQGEYNRFDLGTEMEVSGFSMGVLVSGLVQKYDDTSQNLISVNPVIGFAFKKFKLGVSYDFPLGDYATLKGTGELTFQYYLRNTQERKRVWQKKY